MNVRVAEWQPKEGWGWSYLAQEQMATGHHSVQSGVVNREIALPTKLQEALPDKCNFTEDGNDSLRLVFGDVSAADADLLAEWLQAIFPDLEGVSDIARQLSGQKRQLVFAGFPGRARNLFRLHVEVPCFLEEECSLGWVSGTICPFENVLIVLWHSGGDAEVDTSARVDGYARSGVYSGRCSVSVAELANRYAVEVAKAASKTAIEGMLAVDAWESSLFDSVSREADLPNLSQLRRLRMSATALRSKVDAIGAQVSPGLYRMVWSSGEHEVVDVAVDGEIEEAHRNISQLRSDVSDAFMAANTVVIGKQLTVAQEQQTQVDRLQSAATRLTAFLLVPGLVATVFGADVALPGTTGTERLLAMIAAMIVGAVITFVALRRL